MEQNIFIEKIHALLSECPPEAAQPWYDFAVERVDQQQYVNFKAAESRDESVAEWYEGLRQIKESFGPELAAKVAALGMDHCCLYPGEMPRAAECLQAGDGAKDILAKIESGEIDCENLFSAAAPTEKTYMSSQEFTARMDALIPAPSAEQPAGLRRRSLVRAEGGAVPHVRVYLPSLHHRDPAKCVRPLQNRNARYAAVGADRHGDLSAGRRFPTGNRHGGVEGISNIIPPGVSGHAQFSGCLHSAGERSRNKALYPPLRAA